MIGRILEQEACITQLLATNRKHSQGVEIIEVQTGQSATGNATVTTKASNLRTPHQHLLVQTHQKMLIIRLAEESSCSSSTIWQPFSTRAESQKRAIA